MFAAAAIEMPQLTRKNTSEMGSERTNEQPIDSDEEPICIVMREPSIRNGRIDVSLVAAAQQKGNREQFTFSLSCAARCLWRKANNGNEATCEIGTQRNRKLFAPPFFTENDGGTRIFNWTTQSSSSVAKHVFTESRHNGWLVCASNSLITVGHEFDWSKLFGWNSIWSVTDSRESDATFPQNIFIKSDAAKRTEALRFALIANAACHRHCFAAP